MAERIVSPGVFTREKDLSFLPQGIAEIGAAIIGPTKKGPAFVPTIVSNYNEFVENFGGLDSNLYVPFTVREYLRSAGTVTIVRILGLGGYTNNTLQIHAHKSGSSTFETLAVLAPSALGPTDTLTDAAVAGNRTSMNVTMAGGHQFSASLDPTSTKYIGNVFSGDPQATKAQGSNSPFYLYKIYKDALTSHASASAVVSSSINTLSLAFKYKQASTPYIVSQKQSGNSTNLFKINLRSHGEVDTQGQYKVGILNIKGAGAVAGSDYGSFSLQVREIDTQTYKESDDVIVEQWDNLNLDPDSPNFFARKIGDRYVDLDNDEGKLNYIGDWPNMSKHIYVSDYTEASKGALPKALIPYGHGAVSHPIVAGAAGGAPTASFTTAQNDAVTSAFDTSVFYGFNYSSEDNRQYLSPLDSNAVSTGNVAFNLDDMSGSAAATANDFAGSATFSDATEAVTLALSAIQQRKFVIPFQGGFEGSNPAVEKKVGGDITNTNTQGFDCSAAASSGSVAYKRALNSVSNQDEFDINMVATPGLLYTLHPNPVNHAMAMVESRGDAFYVFDPSAWADNISTTTTAVSALDTNYSATYYPWVKVLDDSINKPTWVPPSVVLPGVYSQNDKVAHEWFAPAGLSRGGLTNVLEAKTRLTHAERDLLYEDRVNPIASFPGQGVVVFGQKTLQAKPSALDRINVRRLLIRLKKFIASSSRYLIFENNTVATRNRFLNIVNPYLDSVQANQGLTAFRVVMDDSNNTPDVIDRNQLVGQIFIQPARAVEFIVLDFVVQPTGATFPS